MAIKRKIVKKEKDGKWVIKSDSKGPVEMVADSEDQALTLVFSIKGVDFVDIDNGRKTKTVDANEARRIKISKNVIKASKAQAKARNEWLKIKKEEDSRIKKEAAFNKTALAKEKAAKLAKQKALKAKGAKALKSVKAADKNIKEKEKNIAKLESKFKKKQKRIDLEAKWANEQISKEEKLFQLAKLSEKQRLSVLRSKQVTLTKLEKQRLNDIMHNEEVKELITKFKKSAKNHKRGFWEDGWTNFEENAPLIESVYINAWEQAGETLKMRSLTIRSSIMFSLLIILFGLGFFVVIGIIY